MKNKLKDAAIITFNILSLLALISMFTLIGVYLTSIVYQVEGIPVIILIGLCSAIGTLLLDMTIERWKEENEEEEK